MKALILSADFISLHRTLFLHAIGWYQEKVAHENWWAKWTIDVAGFPPLTLFLYLKTAVGKGQLVEGSMAVLLSTAVKGYRSFLQDLEKEPWADDNVVKMELEEISRAEIDLFGSRSR